MKKQPNYLSYLLRLWRVNDDNGSQFGADKAVWRGSLENPHTGERKGFAELEALFSFLRAQTGVTDENRPGIGRFDPLQKRSHLTNNHRQN